MKKRGPKAYSEDFRREAVRLAESGTTPMAQIARELGIHLETLRSWRRRARSGNESQPPAAAVPSVVPSLEEENRRLRRENARLLEEREILKKATAFFAKESR
jgi:transposase